MENTIDSGKVLDHRYRILYTFGHDDWGRLYLAEVIDRENDRCIIKELCAPLETPLSSPQQQQLRQKFQILANLHHPQLPRFQDLLQVSVDGGDRLALVQDYIEGLSYRELLNARQQQGRSFSEAEVRDFLLCSLPALIYLHEQNLSHGNICPENIILRHQDRLPILVNFSSVNTLLYPDESQLTAVTYDREATPSYHLPTSPLNTTATPQNDLHALGVTALVLLSGRESQCLQTLDTKTWDWQRLHLTPEFQNVLQRLLTPEDQSAASLLTALQACPPPPQTTTLPTYTFSPTSVKSPWFYRWLGWGVKVSLVFLFCLVAGVMGWFAGKAWINAQVQSAEPAVTPPSPDWPESEPEIEITREALSFPPTGDLEPEPDSELSAAEQERQIALRDRRLSLNIDYDFFEDLVNQVFWQRYPEQTGVELTNSEEDAIWRDRKGEIANEMLNRLTSLSSEARLNLGNYDRSNRQRWIATANDLHLSSRALYDLTDAAFASAFPAWADENLERSFNDGMGQVWQGFMFEQVRYLENGMTLRSLAFLPGIMSDRVAGTLQPGEGQAIVMELEAGQILDLFLNASPEVLISFYSPTGNTVFLEDARDRNWMGDLPESGYYEITLVSTSPQPLDYSLSLSLSEPFEPEL
ncbi:MAG: serine/threonine protein kinase [Spirulinaceae cyanobacterium]